MRCAPISTYLDTQANSKFEQARLSAEAQITSIEPLCVPVYQYIRKPHPDAYTPISKHWWQGHDDTATYHAGASHAEEPKP